MPLKFKLIETNFVQAEKFCLKVELEKNWKLSFLSRTSEIRILIKKIRNQDPYQENLKSGSEHLLAAQKLIFLLLKCYLSFFFLFFSLFMFCILLFLYLRFCMPFCCQVPLHAELQVPLFWPDRISDGEREQQQQQQQGGRLPRLLLPPHAPPDPPPQPREETADTAPRLAWTLLNRWARLNEAQ